MNGIRFKHAVAAAAVALTLATTGCAAGLDSLPLPAPGLGGATYTITATFSNALNLPTKAKVKLNGADVGEVESMSARNYTAVVRMRIRATVRLPVGSTAELRTATPMGDVFVAVTPPPDASPDSPSLADGSAIPLPSTSAAATIEEVLTRASLLVNGGAIESVTRVANSLGEEVGGRGDRLAALIQQTRGLVSSLAARSVQIRAALTATGALSDTVAQQDSTVDDAVAAAGPALQVIGDNTQNMVDLVGRLKAITDQIARFPSIRGTNDRSLMSEVNLLAADLNAGATDPNANLTPLLDTLATVIHVTDGPSAHTNVDVAQLAAGSVPDPNFPGDPGARPPDLTDWTNFVGSLEYSLNRVKNRLTGPGR
jgi:phospholipid/cholesterol/gamma-HCH transport system substrate-binding protein